LGVAGIDGVSAQRGFVSALYREYPTNDGSLQI
jgi:hypothetical protein